MPVRSPAPPRTERPAWWLILGIRLLLLTEGLGLWAVVIVSAFLYGSLLLYYYVAVPILLGPALLVGIPALVVAARPGLLARGRWTPAFLLVNTLGAIVTGALAFSQPDPVPYYALIATTTMGATLLLLVAANRLRRRVAEGALGAVVLLVGYAATYALPPTVPPAPALHLEGVLSVPASAGSVTRVPGGEEVLYRLEVSGTDRRKGTVNPGTYRFSQACDDNWDQPTWATVQVPIGAVVTARNQCPPNGTVRGHVSLVLCWGGPPVHCDTHPYNRQRVGFKAASFGGVFEATTDDASNYTIILPPGRYTAVSDTGFYRNTEPREITVESGATIGLDLTFQAG
jgi:hypothetical protein